MGSNGFWIVAFVITTAEWLVTHVSKTLKNAINLSIWPS